ncbi:MAG: hypothetical protein ACREVG_05015 [Burkholderiales bacterium]
MVGSCLLLYYFSTTIPAPLSHPMQKFIRAAQFLAAFLACTGALAQPEIALVERQSLAGSELGAPAAGSHWLVLTVVQIEGSGWTRERALDAVRQTAAILAQCDVGIARVEWVRLAAPPSYRDFFTPRSRELARLHPVGRPAIYLVRDTRNRPAFDAEAIGRGNSRTRPELANTVWIAASARDAGIVLAHELAHVLMDSGEHSKEPGNLMREETTPGNTTLSAAQCARMQETGVANGLLSR